MTIYIYESTGSDPVSSDTLIDQHDGADNADCERWAADNYSDTERYYWTCTPWTR